MGNLSDWITGAGVIVAVTTYLLTSSREKALRRAELVHTFSSELSQDGALVDLFTDIDYERFRFTASESAWLGQAPEKNVVRLLDLYNSVGHVWDRKIIKLEDVHGTTLGYGVLRAYNDPQVSAYLQYVDKHDFDHLGTGAAFEYFRKLAIALDRKSIEMRARRRDRGGRQSVASGASGAEDPRNGPQGHSSA